MSIIGIDDHPLAALTDLTTVRQHAREQGVHAAQMVIGLLRGDQQVDRWITLPTELVVRSTTAPPSSR
jgi:LacI family transcriptional regulator, repressor for deo operon, udp, cdd, tsx, nupC, and nupG